MKSKLFGIIVCFFLFLFQTVEVIFWRNDFPFTRWGMYSSFLPFAPYFEIKIETDPGYELETLVKDPWDIREYLWPLAGLGHRQDDIEYGLDTYFRKVETSVPQNQEKIKNLLLTQLWHPEDIKHVRVVFYGWHVVTYDNIRKPDVRYVMFPEVTP